MQRRQKCFTEYLDTHCHWSGIDIFPLVFSITILALSATQQNGSKAAAQRSRKGEVSKEWIPVCSLLGTTAREESLYTNILHWYIRLSPLTFWPIASGNPRSPTQDTVWAKDLPTAPGVASFVEYVNCGFGKHVKTMLRANRKSGTPQATQCMLPQRKEMFSG